MSRVIGYVRTLVDAHAQPLHTSPVLYNLAGSTRVEIDDQPGDWLKVSPRQMRGFPDAFIQRSDLLIPSKLFTASNPVKIGDRFIQPLPDFVKAGAYVAWLAGLNTQPAWIDQNSWDPLLPEDKQQIFNILRNALQVCMRSWNDWLATITADHRENEADIAEFRCFMAGGRYVYSILETQAREEPKANSIHVGRISTQDIMLFTGKIDREPGDQPTDWAEISLRKDDKDIHGWVKRKYLDPYVLPTPSTDTSIPVNRTRVFNITTPVLRPVQDPEIQRNMDADRVAQYIDGFRATGTHKQLFNLCGEICIAVILGQDVIPTLATWLRKSPNPAAAILNEDRPTSLGELNTILTTHNHASGEISRYDPTTSPISAARIRELTSSGQVILTGCGITKGARGGKIAPFNPANPTALTAHWVVIVDALPEGTSGWVRVYNPFWNREEVVELNVLKSSMLRLRPYMVTTRA